MSLAGAHRVSDARTAAAATVREVLERLEDQGPLDAETAELCWNLMRTAGAALVGALRRQGETTTEKPFGPNETP